MSNGVPCVTWKEDEIDFYGTAVPVYLPDTLTRDELERMRAFKDWKTTLHDNLALQDSKEHAFHKHPYRLRSIEVKSATKLLNGSVSLIKIDAAVERDSFPGDDQCSIARSLPGTALLKGGSVAILMILRPRDSTEDRYVIMAEQPRLATGALQFLEIPAGTLDDSGYFVGSTAQGMMEALGFRIPLSEVIDMTQLALGSSEHPGVRLNSAVYPSPAVSDEFIALLLWEKELDRLEIEDLRARLTAGRVQDGMMMLHVKDYETLWRDGARDAKTLAAAALYEGLNRSGELGRYKKRVRDKVRR